MIVSIGVDEGLHVTLDTDDHVYPGGDVTSDLCVRAQVLFAAVMRDAAAEAEPTEAMSELSPTLVAIAEAVQAHASAVTEGSPLLTQAIVVYELVDIDDEGETRRQIGYTVPTDNFAGSGALGLLEAGRYYLQRDCLGERDE